MKIYTVHTDPKADKPFETAQLVPEGFNLYAMVFPFNIFWALNNRCWVFLAVIVVFTGSSFVLGDASNFTKIMVGVTKLAIFPFLGIWANDILRWSLKRKGFELDSIVTGKDETDAHRRYLERISHQIS